MTGRTIKISGKALEKLRNSLALTQRELGEKIGLSERRISQIETEEPAGIFPGKFRKLAEGLGLTLEQLFLKIGDESLRQRQEDFENGLSVPQKIKAANDAMEAKRKARREAEGFDQNVDPFSEAKVPKVPFFEAPLAAGEWLDVSDIGEVCDPHQIDHGLFRVRLRGDSMTPNYPDGQVVEFQCIREDREAPLVGRDYYFQRDDGFATFKRLEKIDEDEFILRPLNKRKYPKAMKVNKAFVVRMARAIAKVEMLG